MPEERLKRFSVWADSWWKILSIFVGIILVIYEVSSIWIRIQSFQGEVESLRTEIKLIKEEYKKEIKILKEEAYKELQIRDDRSDKRYIRAVEMYEELKEKYDVLEQEVEQNRIDDAYEKGRNDSRK